MEKLRPAPLPRSYWVDDHLIAGAYPGAPGDAEAEDKVRALVGAGVTLFLDLTTPDDGLQPYEALLTTTDNSTEVRRICLPVPDFSVAPHATVEEALTLLDAEAAAGGISYVHCWGGIGRTGTVVGCYLARSVGGRGHWPLSLSCEPHLLTPIDPRPRPLSRPTSSAAGHELGTSATASSAAPMVTRLGTPSSSSPWRRSAPGTGFTTDEPDDAPVGHEGARYEVAVAPAGGPPWPWPT